MFEGLKYIELSKEKYPYKCDMCVLEEIQNQYGLTEFENRLTGFEPELDADGQYQRNEEGNIIGRYGIPDIRLLNETLCRMVREGLEIQADEENKEVQPFDEKSLIRKVDIAPGELGRILHEEFSRCFRQKNE